MADQPNVKSPVSSESFEELDERVRAAMQALDAAVAPQVYELGAASIMTRLDAATSLSTLPDLETSMTNELNSSVPTPISAEATPVPMRAVVPVDAPEVSVRTPFEDSGLHDLKSLAASAKNRITTRRATMPPANDDALLAAASASFKAMALPEPARIVSLPNPGLVPALARAPKATQSEMIVAADERPVSAEFAPTAKAANKNTLYIGGGIAVVAAAAAAFFLINSKNTPKAGAPANSPVAITTPKVEQAVPMAAAAPTEIPAEAVAVAAPTAVPIADSATTTANESSPRSERVKSDVTAAAAKDSKAGEVKGGDVKVVAANAKPAGDPKAAVAVPVKTDGDAGSVDDLLKEAGVNVAVKESKPSLDKKELTRDDIASVMKGRTGSAQACLGKTGVSGTVGVKLSVAPSGQVTKATATGPLAGTPTGDCVVNAVSGATFPAWDGRPTTVIYSYLLSE